MSESDGFDGSEIPSLGRRVGVTVVVALVVAVGVGVVPTLLAAPPGTEPVTLNNSEYAVDQIGDTALPAEGQIDVSAEGSGTVVFDQAHANDYDREDIQPLVEAIKRAGYDVSFAGRNDLEEELANASAYVVVAPGTDFDEDEIETIRAFTDEGGRVAFFGEPNRISVSATGVGGVQVTTQRTRGEALLTEYGLTIRTSYVYNQRINDGGFKQPVTTPVGPASETGENVPVYTAAPIVSLDGDGEVILRYPEGSRSSGTDATGQFAAAMQRGSLLAVGDATILSVGRFNVADNNAFLGYVVEFLLSGDRESSIEPADDASVDAEAAETEFSVERTEPAGRIAPRGVR